MDSLALFVDVRDRLCVVIGAGLVAQRKIEALLHAGARVRVIAPQAVEEIEAHARDGNLEYLARRAQDEDIDEAFLVVIASNDAKLNAHLTLLAQERGLLVNAAHQASSGNVLLPSVIRRDPIQIAICTGGASPVLGRLLRDQLERFIPGAFGRLAALVENSRVRARTAFGERRTRRRFWEAILTGPIAEQVLDGREAEAQTNLSAAIDRGAIPSAGEVYLVGAGPGDPDLLTFRAQRLIRQADVVVYDRLVSDPIMALLRQDVEKIYAGKERDRHTIAQESINALLVRLAREGKRVLRLKGGDPLVFGRGGEEIATLMEEGIPFQIVPGITAANGCASYAGIPLTHRDHAQACIFVTGHLKDGSVNLNWKMLAHPNQTLVFYMGLAGCTEICQQLIRHGLDAHTPAALITRGTTPEQQVLTGTLQDLPELVTTQEVVPPTLIIVGNVVQLREQLRWYQTDSDISAPATQQQNDS